MRTMLCAIFGQRLLSAIHRLQLAFKRVGLIRWLLIGQLYASLIFGKFLVWGALMQFFFQVFIPERV